MATPGSSMPASGSSPAPTGLTAAQRLQEKHQANANHHAEVSDVVDEDDIQHPPPSMSAVPKTEPSAAASAVSPPDPASETLVGKRKAGPEGVPSKAKVNGGMTLNTQSEEAFPALGGGPRVAAAPPAWGVRKPGPPQTATNGMNGHAIAPSLTSSRASTPTSGILTPASTNASTIPSQQGKPYPQHLALPGRQKERIQFAPSQLLPRQQLKKPLQEIIRGLNKTSKVTVEMKTGPNGNIVFEASGPVEAARQALKDLASQVGSPQNVKIPVPMSVRPHIIGRGGTVINGIMNRTGAKIQLPRDAATVGDEDDDSQTVDVSITGDAVAAEMARREIESIIGERTSSVNIRLREIPPELFPFIAGPHNARINALEEGRPIKIQVPHYHTWSGQPPPQPPADGSFPDFRPNATHHIRIAGDRLVAQEIKAQIERDVEDLRRRITLSQVPIDRGRHQFILENSDSLHTLLEQTGCAVIMPPASEDTELLTVTGPPERIDAGLERIMDLATAMQLSRIDVAKLHPNAPAGSQAHARALNQYLRKRRIIDHLEKQHNARIILPASEDVSPDWDLYFREGRNGIRARQDILNLINAHPPQRLRHVPIDPFFHDHVHRHGGPTLQDTFGVHLVEPDADTPAQHMVIVYEGPDARDMESYRAPSQRPSQQEMAEFEAKLQQAQEHLLSLIQGHQEVGAARISVPTKYRERVQKFVNRQQEDLSAAQIPVQIRFNTPTLVNGSQNALPGATCECKLRGPQASVEKLAEEIVKFVEVEKNDDLERGYVTTFDFPQKFANFLIGKRGETINKYREDFDVSIQVKDGKVEITGPKAKAHAAQSKITALAKKLEDESSHVLKVEQRFHRSLAGPKFAQVNHLQDRYNVRIHFPRLVSDDKSVADDASEADSTRNRRPNQGPDEIIIRGPSKGADAARDELLSLLQYTKDNSHSATVSVSQRQLPILIGTGGQELESLQLATGAKIDIPSRDAADASGRVQVQLKGTKKQVEEAKKLITEKAQAFDDICTRNLDVERKYHSAIIGSGGANIRNIIVAAGGSDDRRELARAVRFPRPESTDNAIVVQGKKAVVEKIVTAIETFVTQREGHITEIVEIAPEKHRLLIGRGGEARRAIESKFNVGLEIPKMTAQGPERSQVKVSGQAPDVEKAQAHILDLTREQEGSTISMPRQYHHAISDNGSFFRRLRSDFKVSVDHAGQQPPNKPSPSTAPKSSASMPLITDDSASHSWELVDNTSTNDVEITGDIPWILRGPTPESVASAHAAIEKALNQAKNRKNQCTGYLIVPDPSTYRLIIGQGGSRINTIRKQTGCQITVPRDQIPGSKIEIVGEKSGVEEARDIILETVKGGKREY